MFASRATDCFRHAGRARGVQHERGRERHGAERAGGRLELLPHDALRAPRVVVARRLDDAVERLAVEPRASIVAGASTGVLPGGPTAEQRGRELQRVVEVQRPALAVERAQARLDAGGRGARARRNGAACRRGRSDDAVRSPAEPACSQATRASSCALPACTTERIDELDAEHRADQEVGDQAVVERPGRKRRPAPPCRARCRR